MMKFSFFLLCLILIYTIFGTIQATNDNEYNSDDARQFLQKRLFGIPFPREQRREAKEHYEEKCERPFHVNNVMNFKRWCPKLEQWDQWRAMTTKNK